MPRRTGLGEDGPERGEGGPRQPGRQSDTEGRGADHDVPPSRRGDTVTAQPTATRRRGPGLNG